MGAVENTGEVWWEVWLKRAGLGLCEARED